MAYFRPDPEIQQPVVDVEIASVDKDPLIMWVGELLPFLDPLMREKGGLEAAERVADDEQVKSVWQQRTDAQKSFEIIVEPGSDRRDAKKAADWLRELLTWLPFDDLTEKMGWSTFFGFSYAELMLVSDGKYITLDPDKGGIRVRRRDRFRFTKYGEPRLLTLSNQYEGEALHASRNWVLNYGGDHHDDPYGRGLWRWLFWPVFFKRGDLQKWLRFLEDFAAPSVMVTTPPGASEAEKKAAIQLAQAIRAGTSGRKTEGTIVELIEATRSGTADYATLHAAMNSAISKVILSQTMTTDSGSSYAQAEVHEGVALRVIKSDSDLLCQSFNTEVLAKRLCHWNFPDVEPPRIWRQVEPPADTKADAETDQIIFGWGYRPKADYVTEKYGDNYTDLQSAPEGEEEREPPLYQGLGVGGTQSLLDFLQSNTLSRDAALAVLQQVFGLTEEKALMLLPEEPEPDRGQEPERLPTPEATEDPQTVTGNPLSDALPPEHPEAEFAAPVDLTDAFAARLRQELSPVLSGWVDRIEEALGDAESLESFASQIPVLFPDLPSEAFRQALLDATVAAELAGRYESEDEG
ncbi:phage portal protein family protein [Vacuolonema iberomarrocanum]|uniref:phage portal protein family protein n=1 Tax=Vacuolonema iberomarrocanum TaxID=3454632 RepID=UPI0019ECE264|nr:DUF935 family protein [filamentous cyanobacterium LEGE 07170]